MKKIILPLLLIVLLSACVEKTPSTEQTIPIIKPIENKITKS